MTLFMHPPAMPLVADRKSKQRETLRERRTFANAHKAETRYARNLRTIAKHCGDLARFWSPDDPATAHWVIGALRRYAGGTVALGRGHGGADVGGRGAAR